MISYEGTARGHGVDAGAAGTIGKNIVAAHVVNGVVPYIKGTPVWRAMPGSKANLAEGVVSRQMIGGDSPLNTQIVPGPDAHILDNSNVMIGHNFIEI